MCRREVTNLGNELTRQVEARLHGGTAVQSTNIPRFDHCGLQHKGVAAQAVTQHCVLGDRCRRRSESSSNSIYNVDFVQKPRRRPDLHLGEDICIFSKVILFYTPNKTSLRI